MILNIPIQDGQTKEEAIPEGWDVLSIQSIPGNTGIIIVVHLRNHDRFKQRMDAESGFQA